MAVLSARLTELNVETTTEALDGSEAQALNAVRVSVRRARATLALWFGSDDEDPELFIYDTASDRVESRHLPRTGNAAADREELAIITCSTVAALLESQRDTEQRAGDLAEEKVRADTEVAAASNASTSTSTSKPATSRVPPKATEARDVSAADSPAGPAQAADTSSSVGLLLGYMGTSSLAPQHWQSGASATLLAWFPHHLHAGVSYGLLPMSTLNVGESEVTLSRVPLSAAFGIDARSAWPVWQWLIADVVLAVDEVSRTTRTPAGTLVATPPASRWLLDAGGRVGAAVTLVSNLGLYALLGGKLGLSRFDYVAEGETSEERVTLGRAAWQLDLGVCVSVF
jgi:hypothetical protein